MSERVSGARGDVVCCGAAMDDEERGCEVWIVGGGMCKCEGRVSGLGETDRPAAT